MNVPVGYRVLAVAGLVLALVMVVLMFIGTYSQTTFYTWGAFALVGAGAFALGRRLDSDARARIARADLERRRKASATGSGPDGI